MARSTVANYRYHVSGQARVSIANQDFYLGKYGSPESLGRYHSLLAEYAETGLLPNQPTYQVAEALSIRIT